MYKIKHICMYFLFSYVVEHTCCVCLLASFAFLPHAHDICYGFGETFDCGDVLKVFLNN
jgi:hypothetical protein